MNSFLNSAEENLKSARGREAIMAELSDHFETKKELYMEIGWDEEYSEAKADEAMGDGEIVGQRLSALYANNKWRVLVGVAVFLLLFLANAAMALFLPIAFDGFIGTLLGTALIYAINMALTAVAIKRRMTSASLALVASTWLFDLLLYQRLAYPLGNALFFGVRTSNNGSIALAVFVGACISLSVAAPNIFNIYHISDIKSMKNTKKQNLWAKRFMVLCLALPIILGSACYPLNALNAYAIKKQPAVQAELEAFLLDVEKNYDKSKTDELREYIEGCEYNFELSGGFVDDYYNDYEAYHCCRGNSEIIVRFNNGGYIVTLRPASFNRSQDIPLADYDVMYEVEEYLGNVPDFADYSPEYYNEGHAVGMTKAELHEQMKRVEYSTICVFDDDSGKGRMYYFDEDNILGHNYKRYTFIYENDACTRYAYEYDEFI